jgi:beta-xylosidase
MTPVTYRNPIYDGYFADPFVLAWDGRYVAYGTGAILDGLVFETLVSSDLVHWERIGGALRPVDPALGGTYWAPEVVWANDRFWMYYSVGTEHGSHQLRVASAATPLGPFVDQQVNLSPLERFAIDPHPFCDTDGTWYLFYARDVLEGPRVGTQLAVDVLTTMTSVSGNSQTVLAATADWQLFEADRSIYGSRYDWHTLEGPTVLGHDGGYYLFYSGGSWQGHGYSVAWARADHPLGPWREPDDERGRLLATVPGHVYGPGHNSLVTSPGGLDVLVYHAWDAAGTKRRMCIDPLTWGPDGPSTAGPSWEPRQLDPDAARPTYEA